MSQLLPSLLAFIFPLLACGGQLLLNASRQHLTLAEGNSRDRSLALGANLKFQIFGLYDSGTNLLQMVLHAAYPQASICPDTTESRRLNGGTCRHRYPTSKHDNPWYIQHDFVLTAAAKGIHSIFMVRNPVSNLLSIHEHPYGLSTCAGPFIHSWVSTTCSCDAIRISGPGDKLCKPQQSDFPSVAAVWTEYVEGFLHTTASSNGSSLLIRYEDLVLTPENVMDKIDALAFNNQTSLASVSKAMRISAKHNGVGRREALEKIKSRSYRKDPAYQSKRLRELCARLPHSLLTRLHYEDECL